MSKNEWILSGSELSPFHLKVAALLRYKQLPFRSLPTEGSLTENLRIHTRVSMLKAGWLRLTYPPFTELDELPLVPFLFGPNGENLYDSSAIAEWLDRHAASPMDSTVETSEDPKLNFLIQLVDEFFDEFGLYLVHHARWKISASDNTAGQRLAKELPISLELIQNKVARYFSARQTRRCPYLFSVAPEGFHIEGLPEDRQPPSRPGFPPTHELLEHSYSNLLRAMEAVLCERPYLFGERFTLADASVYGQLGMNLSDPAAAKWIKNQAPAVFDWLHAIHHGDFSRHVAQGDVLIDDKLTPLIAEISRVYYPLMRQNEQAYIEHKSAGETLFNEKAFWKDRALFHGEIDGQPFMNVAKTFQVKTWRKIKTAWAALASADKNALVHHFPAIAPE